MVIDTGARSTAETTKCLRKPSPRAQEVQPKRAKSWDSTGNTPLAGDGGRRGNVRQGWEERIPKKIFFPSPWERKKEQGTGQGGSAKRLRPASVWAGRGWLSSPLTAPSSVAPPSECIWRSSSSSSSAAAGAGKPGWGPLAGPSRRLRFGSLPPPSGPVTPRLLDSGPSLPQDPHLPSLPPSLLPRGAGSDEGTRAPT